ncbi:MAG: hypothetical protein VW443_04740 [Pseudomonadales bacterium]|jgi:hypothetical protein
MWYTFSQNNSGGVWDGPQYVSVEADTADEANEIAEIHMDIYFDGCHDGSDCPCCGDRWYRVNEHDGDVYPSVYGKSPKTLLNGISGMDFGGFKSKWAFRSADGKVWTVDRDTVAEHSVTNP